MYRGPKTCPDCLFIIAGDFNFPAPKEDLPVMTDPHANYMKGLRFLVKDQDSCEFWPFVGSVCQYFPMREVWREAACTFSGQGSPQWGSGANGIDGSTLPSGERFDLIAYNDSKNPVYKLRPTEVRVEKFPVLQEAPGIFCNDRSGVLNEDYVLYLSDHFGVAATFVIGETDHPALPPENDQCGAIGEYWWLGF